jgi:tetratricopeptide (TPR) repeat protein
MNPGMLRKISYTLLLLCGLANVVDAQDEIPTAQTLYDSAHYDQALVILTEFLEQGANPEAYKMRGDCLQKLGDPSMALNDYDKARVYGYKEDDLFLNRGICKSTMGQMESARLDLVSYIERRKDDPRGYYWMAAVEYLSMENKACDRYVDMAIALDSTYSDAYYLKGANLADQGKNLQAMENFQLSFEYNTAQHRAKLNVAIMLIDMGQFRSAMEILSELRLENIDFQGEVLYYRGEAMYLMHDIDGACNEWKDAAELGDADAALNQKKLCQGVEGKVRKKQRSYAQF